MASFSSQLKKFAKKAIANHDKAVRLVVYTLYERIDLRSPVGDGKYWKSPPPAGYVGGHFRANWQYTKGAPASGEVSGVAYRQASQKVRSAILSAQASGVHYLTNNVPYARRIEDGWAKKAPQGVVNRTLLEFPMLVRNAANEVNK